MSANMPADLSAPGVLEGLTEKELRRLRRVDLLEMLVEQGRELERTRAQLAEARAQLEDRRIQMARCGSIAQASLELNRVFEAAQAAADQYVANVQRMADERVAAKRVSAERVSAGPQQVASASQRGAAGSAGAAGVASERVAAGAAGATSQRGAAGAASAPQRSATSASSQRAVSATSATSATPRMPRATAGEASMPFASGRSHAASARTARQRNKA